MKAIVTVDLGYGDGGKGATVEFLCKELHPSYVVRSSGGPQCAHNVVGPDGKKFPFAQFGSGTFEGVPTFLSQHMMLDPVSLEREAEAIQNITGQNPYKKLVLGDRLITTDFHKVLNRWKETNRTENRHGSCGMGVGETKSYYLRYGHDALTCKDFADGRIVYDKLCLLRERLLLEHPDCDVIRSLSTNEEYVKLRTAAGRFSDCSFLDKVPEDWVIFEGAQGIMIDQYYGEEPHRTWTDVTGYYAAEIAKSFKAEDIIVIGIIRTYATRHGTGPLPFEYDLPINDDGNRENPWQGAMRYGYLSIENLKYAAEACRKNGGLDYLAVNHMDEFGVVGKIAVKESEGPYTPSVLRSVNEVGLLEALSEIAPIGILASGPTPKDRRWVNDDLRKRLGFQDVSHVTNGHAKKPENVLS